MRTQSARPAAPNLAQGQPAKSAGPAAFAQRQQAKPAGPAATPPIFAHQQTAKPAAFTAPVQAPGQPRARRRPRSCAGLWSGLWSGLWPGLWLLLCLILPTLCLPLGAAAQNALAPSLPVTVLARLPHDRQAYTQGLLLHQGVSFESTGLYGQSSLRRVDPATGRVLARQELDPRFFGEGLALCPAQGNATKARLVQLTWREGVILTHDPATLRPLSRHALRGQGWGLACQGSQLVLSDGTDRLRWLDPRTLAETGRSLRVRDGNRPVDRLNELEWVNGWLLANIWGEDRVAVIRPDTGQVALWLDLAALRRELSAAAEAANGVAYDPAGDFGRGALHLTGKLWETVFVAALPEAMRRPPRP